MSNLGGKGIFAPIVIIQTQLHQLLLNQIQFNVNRSLTQLLFYANSNTPPPQIEAFKYRLRGIRPSQDSPSPSVGRSKFLVHLPPPLFDCMIFEPRVGF